MIQKSAADQKSTLIALKIFQDETEIADSVPESCYQWHRAIHAFEGKLCTMSTSTLMSLNPRILQHLRFSRKNPTTMNNLILSLSGPLVLPTQNIHLAELQRKGQWIDKIRSQTRPPPTTCGNKEDVIVVNDSDCDEAMEVKYLTIII